MTDRAEPVRNKAPAVAGRKKAERARRQSEELLRGIVETAATGICVRQNGRLAYVNAVMAEMSGYRSDELLGMPFADLVHPDDQVATAKPGNTRERRRGPPDEFRIMRKDGATVWVSERVTSIDHGEGEAVLGTLTDITERRTAEATSREHIRQVEMLLDISTRLGHSLNLAELLQGVLESVAEAIQVDAVGVCLLDEQSGGLVLEAHRGLSADAARRLLRTEPGEGFVGRAARPGKAVVVSHQSPGTTHDREVLRRVGLRSVCSVPVMAREKILGVIWVGVRESRDLAGREVRLLGSIAAQIGVAVENAQIHEQAVEAAFTDSLTGLYNRRYLLEQMPRELARAERQATALSLIMIDVDGLKAVNDRLGHDQGDQLLREVADIIRTSVRASDVAARPGGGMSLWSSRRTLVLPVPTRSGGASGRECTFRRPGLAAGRASLSASA